MIRTVFYTGNGELAFPFDGQDGSRLYFQVSDNNGNIAVDRNIYIPGELGDKPEVKWENSKINATSHTYCDNAVVQYVSDEGYWAKTNADLTLSNVRVNKDDPENPGQEISVYDHTDYVCTVSSAESNKFIRVQIWNNVQCFKTAYAYLPYLQSPSSNTPELADFTVGNRGLNVFSDKPVLVHSFWASSNLGSNVEDWLYGGVETGVVQKSGSFTYTNDKLSEIPEGKYYVTIIHFADGTMSMTEVKRMN